MLSLRHDLIASSRVQLGDQLGDMRLPAFYYCFMSNGKIPLRSKIDTYSHFVSDDDTNPSQRRLLRGSFSVFYPTC